MPNFLSWQVAGWEYDTLYEVEISNVAMQSRFSLCWLKKTPRSPVARRASVSTFVLVSRYGR